MDQYAQKVQFSEDDFNLIKKSIDSLSAQLMDIKSYAAHTEYVDEKYKDTNRLFREYGAGMKDLQNLVETIGNYAEKYIPFHFQKAIHDAFLFVNRDEVHKKRVEKYFPRVYRAVHHKILSANGQNNLMNDISELNKLLNEAKYENIGVPITTEIFNIKKKTENVKEDESEDEIVESDKEKKKINVVVEDQVNTESIMNQVNYKINLLKAQFELKAKEQHDYANSKNEEIQAYLQTVHIELQGYIKKIRSERNESVS